MKIKGINPIEQNIEKIVFGAVVIIAGLLTAKQFVTSPNAVSFKGKEYQPSQVDDAIRKDVDALQTRLNSDRSIDYQAGEPLSKWFNEEHDRYLGSGTRLANAIVRPVPLQVGSSEGLTTTVGEFAEFEPPTPSDLRVVARPYTLDENILKDVPELAPFLPAAPPFDISVVHIFADVNGPAIREALLSPMADRSAIPSSWWERDMAILDVVVEREHRLADGTWSDAVVVKTIPGEKSVRDELETATLSEREIILGKVFDEYDKEVYEPSFYTLQGGEPWTPDLVKALEPLSPEAEDAVAKMERAWRDLNKAQRSLDKFLSQDESKSRQGQPGKGGGGVGGGVGEGGRGGSQPGAQTREDRIKRTQEANRKRLEDKLTRAEESYQASKDKVLELVPTYDRFPDEEPVKKKEETNRGRGQTEDTGGIGEGGGGIGEGGGPGLGEGATELGGKGGYRGKGGYGGTERGRFNRGQRGKVDEKPLFEDEAREVWVHDLGVLPDTVYRYRMRVEYLNPFFGREDRLSDAQKDLAKKIYTSSAATEWSEPVNAVSTKQFYVVSGTYDDNVTKRKASFEVYVYTNGKERMASMAVRPGEPIGERRTLMVSSSGAGDSAMGDESSDTAGGAGSGPEGNGEMSVSLDFSTGAVLLDVVEVVEGATSRDRKVQVLVAMADGSIVAFDPAVQRQSKDRQRLRELASKDEK